MGMGFQDEHSKWLKEHIRRRTGERRGRLERGHSHGEKLFLEKVWWPLFGHFKGLHPEYEIYDWRRRPYFIDFVWKSGHLKFAFEVKGYGPHVQNTDRTRYRQELNRETYLQVAGYRVVSIPYDDLESCPELTISLLQSLLGSYIGLGNSSETQYSRMERDIVRIAAGCAEHYVRPIDLANELGADLRTIRRHMDILCKKGKFKPLVSGQGKRICRYEYIHSFGDKNLL